MTLEIESSSYSATCTVGDTMAPGMCTLPSRTAGDVDFFVMFELAFDSGEPPHGFLMRAWEEADERSLRGPRDVTISIVHQDQELLDESFELEYVRDPEFWGDRKCGYCDLSESMSSTWQ